MHETMTARKLCEVTGDAPDTLRMRFAKLHKTNPILFPERWRIDSELTPAQITALIKAGERKGSAPKTTESAATYAANIAMTPAQGRPNEVAPQRIKQAMNWLKISVLAGLALIVVGHSFLIWYDMGLLWRTPGLIGGGVVFLFILTGMGLMSESSEQMAELREHMMWAVTLLEALAIFVHSGAFSRNGGEAYAAGMGIEYIWAISAVICLCSIGATVFYQKVIAK